jgi:hypothetical protein
MYAVPVRVVGPLMSIGQQGAHLLGSLGCLAGLTGRGGWRRVVSKGDRRSAHDKEQLLLQDWLVTSVSATLAKTWSRRPRFSLSQCIMLF